MKTLPIITISLFLVTGLFLADYFTDDTRILIIITVIQTLCLIVFGIFICILIKQIADGEIDV